MSWSQFNTNMKMQANIESIFRIQILQKHQNYMQDCLHEKILLIYITILIETIL